ncbi:MAG: TIGR03118 family protein [Terriglobia bacterium]
MRKATYHSQLVRRLAVWVSLSLALGVSAFAQDSLQQYTQTNLVSSQAGVALSVDPDLVNSWGVSRSSGSPWWVSDNGTGKSTLYTSAGTKEGLIVTVPSGDPSVSPIGTPTGTIYNGSSIDFLLAPGEPALFMFVTQDGTISGWNPGVNPTEAVIEVNEKGKSVFTGVTVAQVNVGGISTTYLYVADFRKGRVQVYDTSFHHVSWGEERFDDDWLPEGYAPFNIQNIGGNLYVAYAKQDAEKYNAVDGPGFGHVDVFSPSGRLLQRFEHGAWLNAPWGLTLASSDFGLFSHDVLVGQFGSGEILAFNPVTGHFEGKLLNPSNQPIAIDGLWALGFGNGGTAGPETTLFFTAGPDKQSNGLFGTLTAIQKIQGNDQ